MARSDDNDGEPSWRSVDVDLGLVNDDDRDNDVSWNSPQLAAFLESIMRVTFAGFGGALVGLSHQRGTSGSKIFHRAVQLRTGVKQQRGPPLAALRTSASNTQTANLPAMWAGSFMLFVAIVETCRVWSPTSLILQAYQDNREDSPTSPRVNDPSLVSSSRQSTVEMMTTIMDYTLGGTVAGLAVSMARRPPPISSASNAQLQLPTSILRSGRRSLMISGIGTGMALGCLAGILQMGIDRANQYLELLRIQQQELEQQEHDHEQLEGALGVKGDGSVPGRSKS